MQKTVTLTGGSPWGFRLVGGCDFHAILAISKVTPGGKADRAGLKAGDVIAAINNNDTSKLSHVAAQNQVKSSTQTLVLTIGSPQKSDPLPPQLASLSISPTPSYTPKPPTQTATTTHTWQPKASQPAPPPPSSVMSAPLPPPPSDNDFLPPPPSNESLRQINSVPKKDDFPAPPITMQVNTEQPGPNETMICEGCKQPITKGSYLVAQGKYWHPEEFVCATPGCGRSLQGTGFIEEKGKRYCSDCHEKNFARMCGKCHQKIVGEVMHALNQTWHVTCFVCTACGQAFRDGVFQLENNNPYCVEDFNRLFGSNCKGCGLAITAGDQYVEAIKASWHDRCFICAVCHIDLKNAGFFAVNERPVCGNHKNARLPA